jgi:chloramphenicol-sensitive protein RarD
VDRDLARQTAAGAIAVLTAFFLWGVFPLYFQLLKHVGATELLVQRILWTALALFAVKLLAGRLSDLRALLASRRATANFFASACCIGGNWLIFVYAVTHGLVLETSLGYFICPLFTVLLGVLLLGEALRPARAVALLLALAAVTLLVWHYGHAPWIALGLAATFAVYGLLRKRVNTDPLTALFGDVAFILPFALFYLGMITTSGSNTFLVGTAQDRILLLLLAPLTILPLGLFAYGARRLDLATVGFAQYITPTISFLCAVFLLGERFDSTQFIAFLLIWTALGLYSVDVLRLRARVQKAQRESAETAPVETPAAATL